MCTSFFLRALKKRVRVLRVFDNTEIVVKPEALHDQQDLFSDLLDYEVRGRALK